MNFTNIIKGTPQDVYTIQDAYVHIFDFKTPIRVDSEYDLVRINEIALSEELSMKFKYVLGSLNFLNEAASTVEDEEKRSLLLISCMKAFLSVIVLCKAENDARHFEKVIDYLNEERLQIRNQLI